ncbi:MAG: divergent polysaccharide deacetylase family protein [Pseudomonadota bacterium]
MTARIPKDPSPIKAGFVHGALSFTALSLVFASAGGLIHLTGDADAGSPNVEIALFDENGDVSPTLKTRLPSETVDREIIIAALDVNGAREQAQEPSLGVEYGQAASRNAATPRPSQPTASQQNQGIRINGKLVAPGQSLSQLDGATNTDTAGQSVTVDPTTPTTVAAVEAPKPRPNTPFERYSRPFENAEDKPTISLIVGGMGINWRHTQAAIDELPAEVTLSFAPGAKNLTTWVRRARADGHEVLIELPLEPYSYGRTRPHPQVLQSSASEDINRQRLDKLLRRVSGYAGVINYQGAKFATNEAASKMLLTTLDEIGLAFFEDGSLDDAVFSTIATDSGVTYAASETVIDALPEGDPIESKLMYLEAQARTNGRALGTAFAYPISIDMLKDWTSGLEAKGYVLAPASHYARQQKTPQTISVQTSGQPLQPAP